MDEFELLRLLLDSGKRILYVDLLNKIVDKGYKDTVAVKLRLVALKDKGYINGNFRAGEYVAITALGVLHLDALSKQCCGNSEAEPDERKCAHRNYNFLHSEVFWTAVGAVAAIAGVIISAIID